MKKYTYKIDEESCIKKIQNLSMEQKHELAATLFKNANKPLIDVTLLIFLDRLQRQEYVKKRLEMSFSDASIYATKKVLTLIYG